MQAPGGWCPECGEHYASGTVACPRCRSMLADEAPVLDAGAGTAAPAPVVVHRVPDAAAGALLAGLLEHHGVRVFLRSATLPGYGDVRRDWGTSAWGELLVHPRDAEEARELIVEYLAALERGGRVRDEDVDEGSAT